jgi:hypothetical protein
LWDARRAAERIARFITGRSFEDYLKAAAKPDRPGRAAFGNADQFSRASV